MALANSALGVSAGIAAGIEVGSNAVSSSSTYEHTVANDLGEFIDIFRDIFQPGYDGSSIGAQLAHAAPLFGLIFIVYGLIYFILITTIFKPSDESDKIKPKYARMIAIGIAIIGIAQQSVFNAILAWSTFLLIAAFIMAVIFILLMFLNRMRTKHYDAATEMKEAYKTDLTAKKELLKVKHDVKLDKKYYSRVKDDLSKLDNDLDNIGKLTGSESKQLDEISRLMTQLASAHQHGDTGIAHQYGRALGNKIGALISSLKHEHAFDNALNSITEKIDAHLGRWSHEEHEEESEEQALERMIEKLAQLHKHAHNKGRLNQILKTDNRINHLFREMHSIIKQLRQIKKSITFDAEGVQSLGYQKKHMEATEMRNAIFNEQYAQAHSHLDNLRSIIGQEPHYIEKFKSDSNNLKHLVSDLHDHETEISRKLATLSHNLDVEAHSDQAAANNS